MNPLSPEWLITKEWDNGRWTLNSREDQHKQMKQSQDYESPRIAELVTAALRPAAVVPAPP